MATTKADTESVTARTTRYRSDPAHLIDQRVMKSADPESPRRILFRVPLAPGDRITVFGRDFPSRDDWTFQRFRRNPDGKWVPDRSAGLKLNSNAAQRLRNGLLLGLHQLGFVAPTVSFSYLADRYEHDIEEGDANALVCHLVLKALALAVGNGDGEALAGMGREALRYIRVHRPDFVPVGEGEGALDLKGDEGRRIGKDRLLRTAIRFCTELSDVTDFDQAADELSWEVERLHPEAFRQAEVREAATPGSPKGTFGRTQIAEKLAEVLRRRSNPTPGWVARKALRMFGVEADKVKHYFDYR